MERPIPDNTPNRDVYGQMLKRFESIFRIAALLILMACGHPAAVSPPQHPRDRTDSCPHWNTASRWGPSVNPRTHPVLPNP